MGNLLCIGTAGMSVWFSRDQGETWSRPYSESGLYLEARVWALATHPARPGQVLAGTDSGIYRWDEATGHWTHLPSALDQLCVWSLAQAPHDPDLLLAGTQPAGLYRSEDAGRTWRKLAAVFAEDCPFVHSPRVTQILFSPYDPKAVWCGVEIDGVHRSQDGGVSWRKSSAGLVSDDVHGLAVADGGKVLFATTNKGLHLSRDGGERWQHQTLESPWQYTRAVTVPNGDDRELLLTNGNGPPGSTGRLLRSRNAGASWDDAGLPGPLNSTPWCVAASSSAPDLLFVPTNLGQLFRSTDRGRSWTKLAREFGEVRSAALLPI